MTRSYAVLELSRPAYDEIAGKLKDAGYGHAFDGEIVDMHGIALQPEEALEQERNWQVCPHRECGENMRCNWPTLKCSAPLPAAPSAITASTEPLMAGVPDVIYLQTGGYDPETTFDDLSSDDLTWCRDQIERGDTKYVRADLPAAPFASEPVPMILHCPRCFVQHIDAPDPASGWTNPPHATHTCAGCGLLWRPSNKNTTGVITVQAEEEKHLERIAAAHPATHRPEATASREVKTVNQGLKTAAMSGGAVS